MDRQASTLRISLHPDIRFLAKCRRGHLRQPRKEASQAWRVPVRAGTQRGHPPLPRRNQRKSKALHLDQRPKQNHRCCQTRAPSVRFDPLALSRSPDSDTKPFAEKMVKDHQETSAELKALVEGGKVKATLPSALDAEHQKKLDDLRAKLGKDFDSAYDRMQM